MRILTYQFDEKKRLGFLSQDECWIYPASAAGMDYADMKELIDGISESEIQLAEHISTLLPYEADIKGATPIEDARILAPILYPVQDVICLGVNYVAHVKESAEFLKCDYDDKPPHAVYFGKRVNRASGQRDEINSYEGFAEGLDYEAELAVIIGKDAKDVAEEDVEDYISGTDII